MLTRTLVWLLAICHIVWWNEFPKTFVLTLLILALTIRACRRHFVFLFIVASGFTLPHVYKIWFLERNLTPLWQEEILAKVKVEGLARRNRNRTRFRARLLAVNGQELEGSRPNLLVNWYFPTSFPDAGETWQLRLKIKPPRGLSNRYGFDYERWLLMERVHALAVVKDRDQSASQSENRIIAPAASWSVSALRQHLRQAIANSASEYQHYLGTLVLGDRSALPPEESALFRQSGTAHLFAISGLHVGMIAAVAFFLVSRLCLVVPGGQGQALILASFAALGSALFYALVAGLTLPTLRAVIMISLVCANALFAWNLSRIKLFCLALIIVLLLNPWQVLGAGFWLSFGAVFILIQLMEHKAWTFAAVIQAQSRLVFAMAPLNALFFSGLPLLAPLFNALLIPVFTLAVVPLAFVLVLLLGLAWPSDVLSQVFDVLLSLILSALKHMDAYLGLVLPVFSGIGQVFVLGLVCIFMAPPILPKRLLMTCLSLVTLAHQFPYRNPSVLEMTVFDVGHSLAILVEVENKTLLFDTGFRYPSGFNAGDSVILPHLRAQGIEHLDALVLSHGDSDHVGGYPTIAAELSISRIWAGQPENKGMSDCHQGKTWWRWGQWEFEFLEVKPERARKNNDYSCVLSIASKNHRLLLTGDIEKKSERNILRKYSQLRVDTLLIPHHGSATSSSEAFVKAMSASRGIIASGYENHYGLPNTKVLQRYQEFGTRILRTDELGQIQLHIWPDGRVKEISERRDRPRFWHWSLSN